MADKNVGFCNGSIRLEEVPAVYYTGQTLHGTVVFNLNRPLTFSTLCVRFVGEAKVSYIETKKSVENGLKVEKEQEYQSHEVYFNDMETLAGENGLVKLRPTNQSFPFKYQIPSKIPSSFKGEHGSITYTIIATVVYPDMRKEELTKEFTVVVPFDLNKGSAVIRDSTVFVFTDDVRNCCLSFWGSHTLTVHVKLPVSGYCPGQVIPAAVEVENYSDEHVKKITFEILSREVYRTQEPPSQCKLPEKVIVLRDHGSVMGRTKKSFTCEVPVPAMIAVNLEYCNIINVAYFFRVTFKLSGFNDDLQGEAEIYLGSVPITETLRGTYDHPMAHLLPAGPIPNSDDESNIYANVSHEEVDEITEARPLLSPRVPYPSEKLREVALSTPQTISPRENPPPYPGNNDSKSPSDGETIEVHSPPNDKFAPSAPSAPSE